MSEARKRKIKIVAGDKERNLMVSDGRVKQSLVWENFGKGRLIYDMECEDETGRKVLETFITEVEDMEFILVDDISTYHFETIDDEPLGALKRSRFSHMQALLKANTEMKNSAKKSCAADVKITNKKCSNENTSPNKDKNRTDSRLAHTPSARKNLNTPKIHMGYLKRVLYVCCLHKERSSTDYQVKGPRLFSIVVNGHQNYTIEILKQMIKDELIKDGHISESDLSVDSHTLELGFSNGVRINEYRNQQGDSCDFWEYVKPYRNSRHAIALALIVTEKDNLTESNSKSTAVNESSADVQFNTQLTVNMEGIENPRNEVALLEDSVSDEDLNFFEPPIMPLGEDEEYSKFIQENHEHGELHVQNSNADASIADSNRDARDSDSRKSLDRSDTNIDAKNSSSDKLLSSPTTSTDLKSKVSEQESELPEKKGETSSPEELSLSAPPKPILPPNYNLIDEFRVDEGEIVFSDKILGGGAQGIVTKGTFRLTPVAIKSVQRGRYENSSKVEMNILAKLSHPSIMKLMAWCETRTQIHMVLEYFEGRTLWDVSMNKQLRKLFKFDDWIIGSVMKKLAEAMAACHLLKPYPVIHRDFKPSNVMLDFFLNVKIFDFGFSKCKSMNQTTVSACGKNTYGTFTYMPHEVAILDQEATTAADIYALGCTMVEAYSGENLWKEEGNPNAIALKKLSTGQTPDHHDVAFFLHDVVKKSLNHDPALRPTIEEFVHVFNNYIVIKETSQKLIADRARDDGDSDDFGQNMSEGEDELLGNSEENNSQQ